MAVRRATKRKTGKKRKTTRARKASTGRSAGKFEVTIANEDIAAWMAINNSFTYQGRRAYQRPRKTHRATEKYWNGALIQLGHSTGVESGQRLSPFERIRFKGAKSLDLTAKDFRNNVIWINVVGKLPGARAIPKPLPMDEPNGSTDLLLGMNPDPGVPYERIEPKSLRNYFHPFKGGITLWHEKGYRVRSETVSDNGYKVNRFTFELDHTGKENFHVTIWKNGEPYKPNEWGKIQRVDVEASLHHQAGTSQNPPQK